jgi:Tfp pilus assembly protein PilN
MAARNKSNLQINLLPQKGLETSTGGRVLNWLLGAFRTIVIFTEIIIITALAFRVYLDIQDSQLDDEIESKYEILKSYSKDEESFLDSQRRIEIYKEYSLKRNVGTNVLEDIRKSMLDDVIIISINLQPQGLSIGGITPNERSILQLIVNLESKESISAVELSGIKKAKDKPFSEFRISMKTTNTAIKTLSQETKTVETIN